jgi:hypothetical protein
MTNAANTMTRRTLVVCCCLRDLRAGNCSGCKPDAGPRLAIAVAEP